MCKSVMKYGCESNDGWDFVVTKLWFCGGFEKMIVDLKNCGY